MIEWTEHRGREMTAETIAGGFSGGNENEENLN